MLDLEKNNIREAGGVALAGGLAKNTSVRVVNLLSQQQPPGDNVCVAFVELFDTNVTLLKVRTLPTPRSYPPFVALRPGRWAATHDDAAGMMYLITAGLVGERFARSSVRIGNSVATYTIGGSFGTTPHSYATAT